MIIRYTGRDGTEISFEKGHGSFIIRREGDVPHTGHITGFPSDAHFYKFLCDNYPDIADSVYIDIFEIEADSVNKELCEIREEAAGITDLTLSGPND